MLVPKTLVTTGTFGAIIATLGAYAASPERRDYLGTAFGYLLFLLDFILIFIIFKIITIGIANQGEKRASGGLLTGLIAAKLIGLIAAVYVGLVVWKLSVGYVFVGMLLSVALIGIWIAVSYFSGKSGLE